MKQNQAIFRCIIPMVVLLLAVLPATTLAEDAPAGLFEDQTPLSVEIRAPWRTLRRDDDEVAYPATMLIRLPGGEEQRVQLTVERRGISRQKVCSFPPIKLKIDKESAKGTVFQGEKSLKLVTHCDTGRKWADYYVLEMLAYRIYNLVTERSFRVRTMTATYSEVDGGKEAESHFAFVIEDDKDVAKRNGLEKLKIERVPISFLDPLETARFALFQYLIGNLDWSALTGPGDSCCHNGKLIGLRPDSRPIYALPYDFDASGLVDAHYSVPPEGIRVRNVRQRLYRGFCAHNNQLPQARAEYLELREEIMDLMRKETRLSDRGRKRNLKYFEDFFEVLEDDSEFDDEIISECRG